MLWKFEIIGIGLRTTANHDELNPVLFMSISLKNQHNM